MTMSPWQQFVLLALLVVLLLLPTPILISEWGWLLAGHVLFGLAVGLMIGMTKSAVVSSAMPLVFAFAGGSIVALFGDQRTPQDLETLGKQLYGFGSGTMVGLLVGVFLQKVDYNLPLGKIRDN